MLLNPACKIPDLSKKSENKPLGKISDLINQLEDDEEPSINYSNEIGIN